MILSLVFLKPVNAKFVTIYQLASLATKSLLIGVDSLFEAEFKAQRNW